MILGNEEIKKVVREFFGVKLKNIQPASLDLRVRRIYKVKGKASIGKRVKLPKIEKVFEKGKVKIRPNEFFLVETKERVKMGKNVGGMILPRSSLIRSGIFLLTGFVDPGFEGSLTVGIKNLSNEDFEIEVGASFAQLILFEVKGCSKLYKGKYQGGKVV